MAILFLRVMNPEALKSTHIHKERSPQGFWTWIVWLCSVLCYGKWNHICCCFSSGSTNWFFYTLLIMGQLHHSWLYTLYETLNDECSWSQVYNMNERNLFIFRWKDASRTRAEIELWIVLRCSHHLSSLLHLLSLSLSKYQWKMLGICVRKEAS